MDKIYDEVGGAEGYLKKLGDFYSDLEDEFPHMYKGISKFYQNAQSFIQPEYLRAI